MCTECEERRGDLQEHEMYGTRQVEDILIKVNVEWMNVILLDTILLQ